MQATRASVDVDRALAAAFADEWGRILAALIRRTGDWDLAEECAQDAFEQAARRWPADGIPERPGAWLTTVAGNRAIDRLRRAKRGRELLQSGGAPEEVSESAETEAISQMINDAETIEDDRLRLIFCCCHPALGMQARVALTLRSLTGLTTAQIARAFLVPEPTMAKRLTRAKAKIAEAGIPYRVPSAELLPERLDGVLAVLYLLFNEGYLATGSQQLLRRDLTAEAIRLSRLLAQLMPDQAEVDGLLALMLFAEARASARTDPDGELVTLEDQDRALWNRELIAEANALIAGAAAGRVAAGPYTLQALISACHANAEAAEQTDWPRIAALYGLLAQTTRSPVVTLNQAVAVALAGDIDRGLQMLDELGTALEGYHLLDAARADLLRRRGGPADTQQALAAYERAAALAPLGPERRYLQQRLGQMRTATT